MRFLFGKHHFFKLPCDFEDPGVLERSSFRIGKYESSLATRSTVEPSIVAGDAKSTSWMLTDKMKMKWGQQNPFLKKKRGVE